MWKPDLELNNRKYFFIDISKLIEELLYFDNHIRLDHS